MPTGTHMLASGRQRAALGVLDTGDRPIRIGSHLAATAVRATTTLRVAPMPNGRSVVTTLRAVPASARSGAFVVGPQDTLVRRIAGSVRALADLDEPQRRWTEALLGRRWGTARR